MSLGTIMSSWIDARRLLPDDDRKVEVVYYNTTGEYTVVQARFAQGKWRFIHPADRCRKSTRIKAWQEVPKFTESHLASLIKTGVDGSVKFGTPLPIEESFPTPSVSAVPLPLS